MNRLALGLFIVVTVAGLSLVAGYKRGVADTKQAYLEARDETQAELTAFGENIRAKADALAAAATELAIKREDIADEIQSDPDSRRAGISTAGMQRLERAFSSP